MEVKCVRIQNSVTSKNLCRRRAAAKRKKLKLVSGAGGGDGGVPPEEEEDPEEDSSLAGTGQDQDLAVQGIVSTQAEGRTAVHRGGGEVADTRPLLGSRRE